MTHRVAFADNGVAVAGIADPDEAYESYPDSDADERMDDADDDVDPHGGECMRMRLRSGRVVDRSRPPPAAQDSAHAARYRMEMNLAAERRRQQEFVEDFPGSSYSPTSPSYSPTSYSPTSPHRLEHEDEPWFSPNTPQHPANPPESPRPPPVLRGGQFGRFGWDRWDIQLIDAPRRSDTITNEAYIRDLPHEAREPVKLSTCAVCQEDDAPMETVFTGCGHVSTCMSCALRLLKQNNGDFFVPNGTAKCPVCRHPSVPIRIRVA